MDPAPIYSKYDDELIYKNGKVLFKDSTSKHAIKAYFLQEAFYKQIEGDKQIIEFMIEEFKKCNIYHLKTESEKQEIIKFLKDNSNIPEILEDEDDDYYEDDEEIDDSIIVIR